MAGWFPLVVSGVTAINLSNSSLSSLGAQNAGSTIGVISVVGNQTTSIVVGGTHGSLFSVDNAGIAPCNLVAAVNLPAGSYSITLTAT